jgi:hypothetical protein
MTKVKIDALVVKAVEECDDRTSSIDFGDNGWTVAVGDGSEEIRVVAPTLIEALVGVASILNMETE